MREINIECVNYIELERTIADPIAAIVYFAATFWKYDKVTNVGGTDYLKGLPITLGYKPYDGNGRPNAYQEQMTAPTVDADRLFEHCLSDSDNGTVISNGKEFTYVNGSNEGQKVCIWNSPTIKPL